MDEIDNIVRNDFNGVVLVSKNGEILVKKPMAMQICQTADKILQIPASGLPRLAKLL